MASGAGHVVTASGAGRAVTASGAGRAVGGAGPKGEAIAQAALRLFLRDGYERTSVDAIAAEAGVSKRTIYNRYADKENLFLSVLRDTFAGLLEKFDNIAEAYLSQVTDVERDLTAFFREAVLTLTMAPERIALVRLVLTEAPYFPALVRQEMGQRSMHATLARALSRLAEVGSLEIPDPAEAAGHLLALTIDQINSRTMFGVTPISDAEIERILTGGVRVFLSAYRPARPAGVLEPEPGGEHGATVGRAPRPARPRRSRPVR
jgi:TetR/AcrR family transcriptional regulator, mexJK operon transcriptional repressor